MTPMHPDAVGVTIPALDLGPLILAIPKLKAAFARAVEQLTDALAPLRRFVQRLRDAANDPVQVSGLEGRYAVRGGLDPAYASPEALDRLVQLIMAGDGERPGDRKLRLLTSESRSLIAAAAIRGWCYSYGDGPAILAWHRLMGTSIVVVTRG